MNEIDKQEMMSKETKIGINDITKIITNGIKDITNRDIYGHGYPEARLIPKTHEEDCEDSHLDNVMEDIREIVYDLFNNYYPIEHDFD